MTMFEISPPHHLVIMSLRKIYFLLPLMKLDLDNSIGDIKNIIADTQRTLLLSIEERVLDAEPFCEYNVILVLIYYFLLSSNI